MHSLRRKWIQGVLIITSQQLYVEDLKFFDLCVSDMSQGPCLWSFLWSGGAQDKDQFSIKLQ